MISLEELHTILENPESSTLDYKESFYDFKNDKDLKNTAKFVKDVISFSNTIRNTRGLIIFGIKEKKNEIIGIETSSDDSILQEKVKDKVFPRPVFMYYELFLNNMKIGILEFPITKYELPISPTMKLKGLEPGKIYYRNGSSNTEANGIDVIRINDWLKALPGNLQLTLGEEISEILRRLTLNKESLSVILTDLLSIAKIREVRELEEFCKSQLIGVTTVNGDGHEYRIQNVFISLFEIETNTFYNRYATIQMIKGEMESNDKFKEFRLLFSDPITKIEGMIKNFNSRQTFAKMKLNSKEVFGKGDYIVYAYVFSNNIEDLYSNIKQKTIDILMRM